MNKSTKICPPDHIGFLAGRIYGEGDQKGSVTDISIAEIEPGGGGPQTLHTHPHDHLFIVDEGQVTVRFSDEEVTLNAGEQFRVQGSRLHSMWNCAERPARVVGINISPVSCHH